MRIHTDSPPPPPDLDPKLHFKINKFIGEGGYGQVWDGIWFDDPSKEGQGKSVAIKAIPKSEPWYNSQTRWNDVQVEIEGMLTSYAHAPFGVTRFLDVYLNHSKYFFLIMEKADMSLQGLIDSPDILKAWVPDYEKHRIIPEHFVRAILYPIIATLSRLNRHNIFHRDIKPANILCFSSPRSPCVAKITDFGSASVGHDEPTKVEALTYSFQPEPVVEARYNGAPLKFKKTGDVYTAIAMIHEVLAYPETIHVGGVKEFIERAWTTESFPRRSHAVKVHGVDYVAGTRPKSYKGSFVERPISKSLAIIFGKVLDPKVWNEHPRTFIQLGRYFDGWRRAMDLDKKGIFENGYSLQHPTGMTPKKLALVKGGKGTPPEWYLSIMAEIMDPSDPILEEWPPTWMKKSSSLDKQAQNDKSKDLSTIDEKCKGKWRRLVSFIKKHWRSSKILFFAMRDAEEVFLST
ncbi:MAG: kinase-like domain-containing protein [Piptocephalis tieghemiana]|nr:MAG: kinase-like domain-containing protein [Piptocephalis tieghemiana]